jgi:hypothetical protein
MFGPTCARDTHASPGVASDRAQVGRLCGQFEVSDRPTRTATVAAEDRQPLPQIGYERPATVGDARAAKAGHTHPAITFDRGGASAIERLRDPLAAKPAPAAPAGRVVPPFGISLTDFLPG